MDVNMPAYLAVIGAGLACACILFYCSVRKDARTAPGKALPLGLCMLVLGPVFAVLGAKLLFFVFRFTYLTSQGPAKYWLSLRTEELSYYGGVAGVCLAVFLSAKICGTAPGRTFNAFAPAGALMAATARFAEYFLYPTGTGAALEDVILPFPLAVNIVWSEDFTESFLAVFVYEGLLSMVAFVLSLIHRTEPRRFLRTLFYLCLPQILLESLRADAINYLFIHLEQLVCYLFVEGVLVWYAFRLGRKQFSSWVPALAGLGLCGLVVVAEFLIDGKWIIGGSYVPQWITYSVMAAGLAAVAFAEHRADRRLYQSP